MSKYTREQFTEAMKAAVAERGEDFVYPSEWKDSQARCFYSLEDGTPACIVGMALHKLDPDLVPGHDVHEGARAYLLDHDLVDSDTAWAAWGAQTTQDDGDTWGDALEEYLSSFADQ